MKTPNLIPKTQLTFPISIFTLAAIFFISYYFYYIPVNRQDIYKNGFIILENIKTSIEDRNGNFKMMFKGYLDPRSATSKKLANVNEFQALLNENNVTGRVFNTRKASSILKRTISYDSLLIDNAANDVILEDIINKNLIYLSTYANADSFGIAVPFEGIVQPVLQPQKNDLFEAYLVTDKNGLIYKDAEVGVGETIFLDTLFATGKASAFATVKDINIEGVAHKMFCYPIHLGNDEMVLCGLVKTKTYNARLSEIPVSFIYPIVIIFLLLIIFLPLIKFYIMGPDEHIKFHDVALGSLSFFIGAPLITLTLIQVLMLLSADIRAKENLTLLSAQIDSSFRKELKNAYQQLDSLDSLIARQPDTAILQKINGGNNVEVSDLIREHYLTAKKDTAQYYNFDRVAWVDQLGKQRIKGEITKADNRFLDVSERKYFKTIQNNEAYMLPDRSGATFAFEPLNNWVNGDFRTVVSKSSRLDKGYVTALSIQMYSVTSTVLPPGYGFCIIDQAGEVQFHSEMNRNLQENIIDKISPSRQIKEAITSRQENYFNQLRFYGKTNALHIEPISKIPFYLITFYDKGYVVPINMRVFTFSLLFCFFTFLICALIWVFVFKNRYYSYPILYSPVVFLKWLIPRASAAQFYVLGARLLLFYIFLFVFFIMLADSFDVSNYVVLVLVLLFPVNVISGLFVLRYSTARRVEDKIGEGTPEPKNAGMSFKLIKPFLFQLAFSGLAYLYSSVKGYPIGDAFIVFQLLFNGTMWLNYFAPQSALSMLSKSNRSYLTQFSWLALLLIVCVAVLPASLYTWYAHNQEITQSLKKEQLFLAESLQKRKGQINKLISERDTLTPAADYYNEILYRYGIYTIYRDSIIGRAQQPDTCPKKESYEKFYFTIANDIGNNYYDPFLLPALQDSVKDNAWYWCRDNKTTLSLWYNLDPGVFYKSNVSPVSKSLRIVSEYPERYKFYDLNIRGIFLALFVVSLFWGLFLLLRSLTERIFLKKYISITNSHPPPKKAIVDLFRQYNKLNYNSFNALEDTIATLKDEYDVYVTGEEKPAVYVQEKRMLDTIERLKGFYEFVWQKCTDKERYLVLDFAHDGLANYKNTALIYHLLSTGILTIHDEDIKLFSASFRAFIVTKKNTPEIAALQKTFRQNSSWQSFRRPLLIVLLGAALFIFFTQEQTFQKILALVAGISTVSSLLMKFFVDGAGSAGLKK